MQWHCTLRHIPPLLQDSCCQPYSRTWPLQRITSTLPPVPFLAAGPAYNPTADFQKVAPVEVQRQAEAVLGYGSDLSEPLAAEWLDARQEIHDFAHYMPTRMLDLRQRADAYSFPAGQAAAIHEQVRPGNMKYLQHLLHFIPLFLPQVCCCATGCRLHLLPRESGVCCQPGDVAKAPNHRLCSSG